MFSDLLQVMLPLAVILGVVLHGVTLAKTGDLAEISVSEREILISPRSVFKILSLRWNIRLPSEAITSVSVVLPGGVQAPGLRYGAVFFPGLTAGTYMAPDGMSYWLTGQRLPALEITLREGPLSYVVVQVRDPEAAATRIRNRGNAPSGGPGRG
ncbi:hypothetical protein AB0B54_12130 [Microbispora bryophytorum]|uniref:hypothetical protein n=1 Tax=Microbispora bryophytorum TaxID=1460882 RepID=UPI0033EDD858